jgi:hypothetical protein
MISALLQATIIAATASEMADACSGLIISGVIDGPLSGGLPKAIELYAASDVTDLSICTSASS